MNVNAIIRIEPALCVGDLVEVRPLAEIMATLDEHCCLEAMPFMPEMVQFCGQRLRVVKTAHKTCDPTGQSHLRKLKDAVHLETRCDGIDHDGCQAGCLLYWKSAWLRRITDPTTVAAPVTASPRDVAALARAARLGGGDVRYRCQATEIVRSTTLLKPVDLLSYVRDLTRGNVPPKIFLRHALLEVLKQVKTALIPADRWAAFKARLRMGALAPGGQVAARAPLNLQPGDQVRVRSRDEIMATLDKDWKNRGLSFERDMLAHCGKTYQVLRRVDRVIDEKTGKMLRINKDCVILDGIICTGLRNQSRLFCPRGPYLYWREIWLDRVEG